MSQVKPLNILLVVFDSLGEQACLSMLEDLPALASLRSHSACFLNAYTPSPESGPARASLFTGLDMAVHGVWTDGVALPEREITVSQKLADCGYQTWLTGRRQLAGVSHWTTEHPRPFEYSHSAWAHGPLHRSRQNAYLNWLQQHAPEAYHTVFPQQANADATEISATERDAMASLPDELSFNHWVGESVCKQLTQADTQQPFFGMAGFVVGETQGAAPHSGICGECLDKRALIQADAALGKIMKLIRQQGLENNTVVIVTAARGSLQGQGSPPMAENAIKVPLILLRPGEEAQTIDAMVSTVDIAATVYSLAQLPPPRRLQGRPLNENAENATRHWALARLRHPDSGWQTCLRESRWKLIMLHACPTAEQPVRYRLYDLQSDPHETNNLADNPDFQHVLDDMIDKMIDARVALEDRTEPRIASF